MSIVAMAPPRSTDLSDEAVVAMAAEVLVDARAWAVVGRADLDPRVRRLVCARAVALLEEALDTV
jgi:hypothetical protein